MQRRGDSEITISAWCPAWLDGRGVERVSSWYIAGPAGWRVAKIRDADDDAATGNFDMIRTSGAIHVRGSASISPTTIPVICDLSRLRHARGKKRNSGPLEERTIEYAASVVSCPLSLHAVDIRRPVPEDAFATKRQGQAEGIAREVLDELRSLYGAMPLTWAICSTHGRGPSVAELFQRYETAIIIGAVYLSKAVTKRDVDEAFPGAKVADVGSGYEILLTTLLGGPEEVARSSAYDGLWKVLRKASLTGLPWDLLNKLK